MYWFTLPLLISNLITLQISETDKNNDCLEAIIQDSVEVVSKSQEGHISFRSSPEARTQILREVDDIKINSNVFRILVSQDASTIPYSFIGPLGEGVEQEYPDWPKLYLCSNTNQVNSALLDEKTPIVYVKDIQVKDLLGEKENEIVVNILTYFWNSQTLEAIWESRICIYSLPGLTKLASFPTKTQIHAKDYDKVILYEIEEMEATSGVRSIKVTNWSTKEQAIFDVTTKGKTLSFYRENSDPVGEIRVPDDLILRIVDEVGDPILNAKVTGRVLQSSSKDGPVTAINDIDAAVDDAGMITIPMYDKISIDIEAESFLSKSFYWQAGLTASTESLRKFELPTGGIIEIELQKEPEPVRLLKGPPNGVEKEIYLTKLSSSTSEFGFKFEKGIAGGAPTTRKLESDIWVIINWNESVLGSLSSDGVTESSRRLNAVNQLSLLGLNGWELKPSQEVSLEKMVTPPDSSYVSHWTGNESDFPHSFYVREHTGLRFGRIRISFSWIWNDKYNFNLRWHVQDHKANVRSLREPNAKVIVQEFLDSLEKNQ